MKIDWDEVEAEAAALLSQYIQFDTTNPPGNEARAIEFLADVARSRGFEPAVLSPATGRANLILRLPASVGPDAPPVLLHSHADVVPADPAGWSVPPFSGQIRDGYVWGRGALDNKGQGVIFLQALTLLKQHAALNRDIILLVTADEETSGQYGVRWLLNHHPDLIAAEYVWDEGGVGYVQPGQQGYCWFQIAVAEKQALVVKLTAHGRPGHASIPHTQSAPDRLVTALHRIHRWNLAACFTGPVVEMLQGLAQRQPWPFSLLFANAHRAVVQPLLLRLLKADPSFFPLIHNTVTLTTLESGEIANVIPAQAEARLDIRLLPGENCETVLAALRSLIADPQVTLEVEEPPTLHSPTPVSTPFWSALSNALQTFYPESVVTPFLTPGATNSRFFRQAGMKAYGFVPMVLDNRELSAIHGVDERVSTANLRWGIQVTLETLQRLGGSTAL